MPIVCFVPRKSPCGVNMCFTFVCFWLSLCLSNILLIPFNLFQGFFSKSIRILNSCLKWSPTQNSVIVDPTGCFQVFVVYLLPVGNFICTDSSLRNSNLREKNVGATCSKRLFSVNQSTTPLFLKYVQKPIYIQLGFRRAFSVLNHNLVNVFCSFIPIIWLKQIQE